MEDRQRRRLSEVCHGESDAWTAKDGGTLIIIFVGNVTTITPWHD
ncbi:MAG: hypothetical protein ACFFDQ_04185 [Candidatus Thorarchaeota archaeon]